jgi:hypothetical protein
VTQTGRDVGVAPIPAAAHVRSRILIARRFGQVIDLHGRRRLFQSPSEWIVRVLLGQQERPVRATPNMLECRELLYLTCRDLVK